MTPLEYARMLAAFNSRAFYDAQGREFCCFCGAFDDHDPRCWGLGLPKIVAALEAAEDVLLHSACHSSWDPMLMPFPLRLALTDLKLALREGSEVTG